MTPPAPGSDLEGALALLVRGDAALTRGDGTAAQVAHEEAALRLRALDDPLRAGHAWGRAAAAAALLRDRRGARSLIARALELLDPLVTAECEPSPASPPDQPPWEALQRADLGGEPPARLARYALGQVLRTLGLCESIDEHYAQALRCFERALALARELGLAREEADLLRLHGVTHTKRAAPELALAAYREAEARYLAAGDPAGAAYTRGQSSGLYYERGQHAEAIALLEQALAALEARGLPTFWPVYQRAVNLEKLGRLDEAWVGLQEAFDGLLAASRQVASPALRGGWLANKATIVDHTLNRAWARASDEDLLGLLQRAKAPVLADLVAAGPGEADAVGSSPLAPSLLAPSLLAPWTGDADLREVAGAYADARARLAGLDQRAQAEGALAPGAANAPGHLPGAADERRELVAELARLEGLLDARSAALLGVRPRSLAEVQAVLPEGALLLDWVLLKAGLRVVAVTRDEVHRLEVPGAGRGYGAAQRFVARVAGQLGELGLRARAALARGDVGGAQALYERLGLLDELGDALLGERTLRALVAAARELVVVPHRELAAVPWALLRLDGRYLLERCDVSLLPTLALLERAAAPARPFDRDAHVLLLVSGHDDRSRRFAQEETQLVQRELRNVTVLQGGRATRGKVASELGEHDVLHYAGHAALDDEHPTWSHLAVGAGDRDPAWDRLTVGDVLRLRLRPGLALLSACQTARAPGADPEAHLGLAHAFLAAGARTVVATQWPFEPAVSQALVPRLYAGLLRGLAPHAALCAAQRELAARSDALGCPWSWGAFVSTFSAAAAPGG